ncbi:MAG TPA: hypothetical protein PLJ47_02420 [Candidatus Hydrogenedentes bacterium]|nr:hypothetical protein [Candidatus Hydrogenedentota bacterium]
MFRSGQRSEFEAQSEYFLEESTLAFGAPQVFGGWFSLFDMNNAVGRVVSKRKTPACSVVTPIETIGDTEQACQLCGDTLIELFEFPEMAVLGVRMCLSVIARNTGDGALFDVSEIGQWQLENHVSGMFVMARGRDRVADIVEQRGGFQQYARARRQGMQGPRCIEQIDGDSGNLKGVRGIWIQAS